MAITRSSVPPPVQEAGRRASVAVGQLTASWRALPSFILAGGQRCGTTSLFRALNQHPQTARPTFHKGINYFDLNYHRGADWYAGHFPLRASVLRRMPPGIEPLTFEASGYYMFHPLAIQRLANDLPRTKVVLMLRDPVERAYSAWKHESARGFETLPFEDALDAESKRTEGEADRMVADPRYASHSHRHHAYRARGDYVTQLRQILSHIPRHNLHVMYSEDFFEFPRETFSELIDFLGANHQEGISFEQHNARPSRSMPQDARSELRAHFAIQHDALTSIVGRRPPWDR